MSAGRATARRPGCAHGEPHLHAHTYPQSHELVPLPRFLPVGEIDELAAGFHPALPHSLEDEGAQERDAGECPGQGCRTPTPSLPLLTVALGGRRLRLVRLLTAG